MNKTYLSALNQKKLFILSIVSFAFLLLVQFAMGFSIFFNRYGWTLSKLKNFYSGPDGAPFGLTHHLETALPHSVAMGVSIFALSHFFLFTKNQHRGKIYSLWFFTFANCFCGAFLVFLGESFLFLKLFTFFGFQISFTFVLISLSQELMTGHET